MNGGRKAYLKLYSPGIGNTCTGFTGSRLLNRCCWGAAPGDALRRDQLALVGHLQPARAIPAPLRHTRPRRLAGSHLRRRARGVGACRAATTAARLMRWSAAALADAAGTTEGARPCPPRRRHPPTTASALVSTPAPRQHRKLHRKLLRMD